MDKLSKAHFRNAHTGRSVTYIYLEYDFILVFMEN